MAEDYQGLTPPTELVREWNDQASYYGNTPAVIQAIAIQAARWASEVRLKECVEWVANHISIPESAELRDVRRPRPPSLAEQALAAWTSPRNEVSNHDDFGVILRALERLQELEGGNG